MKRQMFDLNDNDNILESPQRRSFFKKSFGAAATAAAAATMVSPIAQAVASGGVAAPHPSVGDKTVLYVNGKVYQGGKYKQAWAEAFVVRGNVFTKVGTTEEILKLRTPETLVVDLRGHTVLPGLIDDHMHPEMAVECFNNVRVDELSTTWDEFKVLVKKELDEHPERPWVFGANLDYLWDDGSNIKMFGKPSHKKILDELIPDKPAYFWECSGHAALVNSKALEVCGITKDTPDPVGGHYVRDENGEATGVLRELAAHIVWEKWLGTLPGPKELGEKQLKPVFSYINSYGLTSVSEVWSREMYGQAYKYLDDNDDLSVRLTVYATDVVDFATPEMQKLADKYIMNHRDYSGKNVKIVGVKYILDGAAAGQTAVVVEPYEGTDYHGPWRNTPEQYREGLKKYDAMGLTVHAHCAGDGAARMVLDAVEELRKKPGNNADKLQHRVAHCAMIHPDDVQRFAELNVYAEFSPVFWYDMAATRVIEQDIGKERVHKYMYPVKPIVDSGAPVAIGTDWMVTPLDPWAAIETIVTRRGCGIKEGSTMNAEEYAISLETAVWMYTQANADSQKRSHEIGSITPGKYADFAVLNQNIFEVPITDVHKTKVLSTVLGGRDVYLSSRVKEIIDLDELTGDFENKMTFASVGRNF
ncbi:amidohydrolase [Endozoicomonas gorgoniicola]|uniref:Amidohydrolase n=1 Tax=Endozoicomonas gorgoniicola TaxID=1234144 RepID=A0ABT3MYU9_9GAMM|nr:amidohydrolase [Endozoicomonas gorgoniicola]MCW7554174.1 amidohydrolase [Endozoicomonas gorgoniicola]